MCSMSIPGSTLILIFLISLGVIIKDLIDWEKRNTEINKDYERAYARIRKAREMKMIDKKVKLKSAEEMKKLVREGKIELIQTADSGECAIYATVGNPSHAMRFWWSDFGNEYLVVDHENPISKRVHTDCEIFFES